MSYPPSPPKKTIQNPIYEGSAETDVDNYDTMAPPLPPRGRVHTAWSEQCYDIAPTSTNQEHRAPNDNDHEIGSRDRINTSWDLSQYDQIISTAKQMEMARLNGGHYEQIVEMPSTA